MRIQPAVSKALVEFGFDVSAKHSARGIEGCHRRALVRRHQARIAGDVRGEDRRQPLFEITTDHDHVPFGLAQRIRRARVFETGGDAKQHDLPALGLWPAHRCLLLQRPVDVHRCEPARDFQCGSRLVDLPKSDM